MRKTKTLITSSILAVVTAMSPCANAITINDPGVVGIVVSGEPASIANEVTFVNAMLALGANGTTSVTIGAHTQNITASGTDYNGTVSEVGAFRLNADISQGVPNPAFTLNVSGYDYVYAKYDGPNGGAVVWYLGGADFTLPSTSANLWYPNANRPQNGYGISHWTGFGRNVPDAGTTLVLLGGSLIGLGALRRRFSK